MSINLLLLLLLLLLRAILNKLLPLLLLQEQFSSFAVIPGEVTKKSNLRIDCGCHWPTEGQQCTDMLLKHGDELLADTAKSQHLLLCKDRKAPKGSPFALSLGLFEEAAADVAEAEVCGQVSSESDIAGVDPYLRWRRVSSIS